MNNLEQICGTYIIEEKKIKGKSNKPVTIVHFTRFIMEKDSTIVYKETGYLVKYSYNYSYIEEGRILEFTSIPVLMVHYNNMIKNLKKHNSLFKEFNIKEKDVNELKEKMYNNRF